MGLPSGTRLGPYEVESLLGSGGMGEVYRARDTRLERIVAVKVLSAALCSEPSLRMRLEREAKSISKLSHAHICTLHDIGHDSGRDFLVMELVDGETLEHRLTKGPLAPDQALRLAVQIAEALATAHKHGIVHRDLKPSNVMLTKSGAKLMDFGLAKESAVSPMASVLTGMTAEPTKLTGEGTIVGTFQYMAPEQLEGRNVDTRADIFAFGAVLYEMLTAKPAFTGKSQASLIAAILTAEPPPIASLQPLTPASLERVINKCLAKDPEERWQSASDLASELHWISEGASNPSSPLRRSTNWQLATWILATVATLALVAAGIAWQKAASIPPEAMLFQAAVPFAANEVAVSPDSQRVAVIAYSDTANNYVLWIYRIGGAQPVVVEGTRGASYPFWSPDGNSLGFFADGKLKKLDLQRGQIQVISDAPNGRGGSWNRNNVILFSPDAQAGIYTVSASGGIPQLLLKPERGRFETTLRWPVFLPDGEHFLFWGANFTGAVEKNEIYVGKLGSQERHPLVQATGNAAYAFGYLVFVRGRNLMAQRFDLKDYAVQGESRVLVENVLTFPAVGRGVFSVVNEKALIAQAGLGSNISRMSWFDRSGKLLRVVGEPGWFNNLRLSPNENKIVVDATDADGQNIDVWVFDAHTAARQRFTFTNALDQAPVWSPNGKQIAFASNQGLGWGMYVKNSDGSGQEENIAMFQGMLAAPWDWSPDGDKVLIRKLSDLWYYSFQDHTLHPVFENAGTIKNAAFSPNGRWLAFASNESGRMEIYVVPFPLRSGKWQVSSGGGEEPVWRKDGRELFFISPDGKLMAAPVTAGDRFDSGAPVALFQTHRRQPISSQDVFSYDVSNDGKRFLIADKGEKTEAAPLSVYLNWIREMEK